jgi:hypothetical protein
MKSGCAPCADLQKVKGVIEWLFDIDAKSNGHGQMPVIADVPQGNN